MAFGRKGGKQGEVKKDDFTAFVQSEFSELSLSGPPPRKRKEDMPESASESTAETSSLPASPVDIYARFGRSWAAQPVVKKQRKKTLEDKFFGDDEPAAASEAGLDALESEIEEVTSEVAPANPVDVAPPQPAPVASAVKDAPKPVASPVAQQEKRNIFAAPTTIVSAPAAVQVTKSYNPFEGSFESVPSLAKSSAPAPAAQLAKEDAMNAEMSDLLSSIEAPTVSDEALQAELDTLDDTQRGVKLVASPERSTNDTLVADLDELKALIAQHKHVISSDFLKAVKQVHDGVNQVLVQRGVAIMTDADEKAEFKQEEKDYLKARAKKYNSIEDRVVYRGLSVTNGLGVTTPIPGIKAAFAESCQDKRRLALKDDFMASEEYKDLRKTIQKTTELVKSFALSFSYAKQKEIGPDKSRYNGVAQGLNDWLIDIKPFSTTISGRYSKLKTAIGWAMIVGGLIAMAATTAAVLASFGLLSVPGLATGFLGANLVTAGVALTGAAGCGLFAGGVTLTVKGAQQGAAKAVTNLVDVTAREAKKLLPHEARQLLKP